MFFSQFLCVQCSDGLWDRIDKKSIIFWSFYWNVSFVFKHSSLLLAKLLSVAPSSHTPHSSTILSARTESNNILITVAIFIGLLAPDLVASKYTSREIPHDLSLIEIACNLIRISCVCLFVAHIYPHYTFARVFFLVCCSPHFIFTFCFLSLSTFAPFKWAKKRARTHTGRTPEKYFCAASILHCYAYKTEPKFAHIMHYSILFFFFLLRSKPCLHHHHHHHVALKIKLFKKRPTLHTATNIVPCTAPPFNQVHQILF